MAGAGTVGEKNVLRVQNGHPLYRRTGEDKRYKEDILGSPRKITRCESSQLPIDIKKQ